MEDSGTLGQIELSEEQRHALRELYAFPMSDDNIIGLSGPGGTGKTYLLNRLLDMYDKSHIYYTLCAPTNKAAEVMHDYTNRLVVTIHSMLKLSPNIRVENLDFRNLKFCKPSLFTTPKILIIDEASMVNKQLYDYLIKCYKKIIIIGDSAQLGPVNDDFDIFNGVRTCRLTKIYRQSQYNPIHETLSILRVKPIKSFEKRDGDFEVTDDIKGFVESVVNDTRSGIDSVVVCYTNKRVSLYNKVIKEALFGKTKEIINGLKVIGNATAGGVTNGYLYKVTNVSMEFRNIGKFGRVRGYNVTLSSKNSNISQFVIPSDSPLLEIIGAGLETIRINAVNGKEPWAKYYGIYGSFVTLNDIIVDGRVVKPAAIKYAYAITAHKSQGSGYDSVNVDMRDMLICRDNDELRQLQYVAFSRTKDKVRVLI